jgi:hypothetical protein
LTDINIPAGPKEAFFGPIHAAPKQISCLSYVGEMGSSESVADSAVVERENIDCACVRMMFGLITKLPKPKKVCCGPGSLKSVVDLRGVTTSRSYAEPRALAVKFAPNEKADIVAVPFCEDAFEEREKYALLENKFLAEQSAETKTQKYEYI